jgi:FkbM family methyltransferase
MQKYTLPNGITVSCLETLSPQIMYDEIFARNVYVQHGITMNEGDTIIDAGANIGLFSLYCLQHVNNIKVYAIEPIPAIFEALKENLAGHPDIAIPLQCGLAEASGRADFFFYPKIPNNSALKEFDYKKWTRWCVNNYEETAVKYNPLARFVPGFLRYVVTRIGVNFAFRSIKVQCPLKTLSDIMEEFTIQTVDILKLDAENCEKQVLQGIREEDWPKIRQISMEVHGHTAGSEGLLDELLSHLKSKGYSTEVCQESVLSQINVDMVYAVRKQ